MKETCYYPKCIRKESRSFNTTENYDGIEINSIQFRSLAIFYIGELEEKVKELEKEETRWFEEEQKWLAENIALKNQIQDYKDGMTQEFRVLQARIEAYRSYCERNGLAEL